MLNIVDYKKRALCDSADSKPVPDLSGILPLLIDWAWEQDADGRFTQITSLRGDTTDVSPNLGKTLEELRSIPMAAGGSWAALALKYAKQQPLVHEVCKHLNPVTGQVCYLSYSGVPLWNQAGAFCGYRGVCADVTQFLRDQELLALEHTLVALAHNDTGPVWRTVIDWCCEAELWTCGAYWQFDVQQRPTLIEFGSRRKEAAAFEHQFVTERAQQLAAPGGLFEQIRQAKRPLWTSNGERAGDVSVARVPSFLFRSTLLCPVVLNNEVVGVFDFASRSARQCSAQFLRTVEGVTAQISQVLQRKYAQQALFESEQRFKSLVHLTSDWFWRQDAQHRVVEVEGRDMDYIDVVVGNCLWHDLFGCQLISSSVEAHQATIDAQLPFRELIVRYCFPNGEELYAALSGEPVVDEGGVFAGYQGIARDVTERRRDEKKIEYLANHDALTGLPNRSRFSVTLLDSAAKFKRTGDQFSLFFIDLDRFKTINDTLGHEAGDQLLQEMARRLQCAVREADTVARLGGDEFVVLLPQLEHADDIARVARKMMAALTQPMTINSQECRVTASIGISRFPHDTHDVNELMKNADIAMYRAKEEGKNNFQFYSESIGSNSLERLALESSLRRALERNEFRLHYQAKLDLKTNKISGVEALLRWEHPDLGLVSPAQFIPLAEETGLIVPIGEWALQTACKQNLAWQQAGLPGVRMAVNLSARQFDDDGLVDKIADALAISGLNPQWLELELTESMVMHNHERAIRMLKEIKRMGVRLAMDDFGVGYSSFAQIKRFPIDTLKIDRSFIRDLPGDIEDCAITQAIIAMGRTLSLTVVAEGVETVEQENFLREHACDETQGFYFSRPVVADVFAGLLHKNRISP